MDDPGSLAAVTARVGREQVNAELTRLWKVTMERDLEDLAVDLRAMGRWFDPRKKKSTIRREIEALPETELELEELALTEPPLVIQIFDRALVTPDGRYFLDQNDEASGRDILCDPLLAQYRSWAAYRLRQLLAGTPMVPVALGATIVLLAQSALDPGTPLELADDDRRQHRALRMMLDRFANCLGGEATRKTAKFDGYPLHHARLRLGSFIHTTRSEGGSGSWIDPSDRTGAIAELAQDLVRRRGSLEETLTAIDGLLADFEQLRLRRNETDIDPKGATGRALTKLRSDIDSACRDFRSR
jgi:hypothetical protein